MLSNLHTRESRRTLSHKTELAKEYFALRGTIETSERVQESSSLYTRERDQTSVNRVLWEQSTRKNRGNKSE